MATIRPIRKTDRAEAFLDFISELIDEDTYLLVNKKPTLKEERIWLSNKRTAIKDKKEIAFTAWDGRILAGICDAKRGPFKQGDNVLLGIALRKKYRGQGLGEKLLRLTIASVKKMFKPKNIWLSVYRDNEVAQRLYKKVGFRTFARLPEWIKHKGRYLDEHYMILSK